MPEIEEKKHNHSYDELSEDEKAIVEAILSHLAQMNTRKARNLIIMANAELDYRSRVVEEA